MTFIRYLSSSLRYQSPILSRQMRTPTITAGHGIKAIRSFVTTPAPRADISIEKFHALDKNIAKLDIKVDNIRSDVKELGGKADKLLFFSIVGAVIAGAGFDLYRDERNWNRGHKQ